LVFIFSINLQIQRGSLVALVGMVGSGKSSILAALLGEMNKVHGRVSVSGTIGYVPQTAWIMNTTLKENILFGRDFDKYLYDRVIEACALKQDLGKLKNGGHYQIKIQNLSIDMLPARDQTEIGEKVYIVEMSFLKTMN
jgi:ATP-binding cassette subfamily C (CFTR/MRP) protein 1